MASHHGETVLHSLEIQPATVPVSAPKAASPVALGRHPPPPTDSLPPKYRAPSGTNAVVPVIERNPAAPTKKRVRKPIDVYLTGGSKCGGAAYIWSAADALRLRNEFRILGDFVGTLPKHTAQNQFLTVPLVLSYEELRFGVSRSFLRMLRDDAGLDYTPPTADEVARYYERREEEREKYADEAIENQERQRRNRLANGENDNQKSKKKSKNEKANGVEKKSNGEPIVGKKRKREVDVVEGIEKEERPAKVARGEGLFGCVVGKVWDTLARFIPAFMKKEGNTQEAQPEGEIEVVDEVISDDEDNNGGEEKEAASEETGKKAAAVLARRRQQAKQAAAVETACVAVDRNDFAKVMAEVVPKGVSPERQLAREIVFADLYDKGYAMSCGAKFGADYLAYAGDAALFHASLAVIVMNLGERMSMYDVIALGRLGDSTKKRTALAYVEGDSRSKYEVRYVGVQWEETLP